MSFPDLRYSDATTHSLWNSIVIDGAYMGKGMPAFGSVLTEEDAQAIRAYVIRQGRIVFGSDPEQ